MKKISLNKDLGKLVTAHGFKLDPKQKYCISLENEMSGQQAVMQAIHSMGLPAIQDWHKWLIANGFSADMPNPTNKFVEPYYGKGALWKTKLSQGIVVKAENDDDFYIIMECSKENEGFKYTQVILTLGGCM